MDYLFIQRTYPFPRGLSFLLPFAYSFPCTSYFHVSFIFRPNVLSIIRSFFSYLSIPLVCSLLPHSFFDSQCIISCCPFLFCLIFLFLFSHTNSASFCSPVLLAVLSCVSFHVPPSCYSHPSLRSPFRFISPTHFLSS